MKPQEIKIDEKEYQELFNNVESSNYEVLSIYEKEFKVFAPEVYKDKTQLISYGKTDPSDENDIQSKRYRISLFGQILDKGITNASAFKDGSLQGFDFYSNWITNEDTTTYKYIISLSKIEEKDSKIWLDTFLKLYENANDIYIDNGLGDYYFKIEDKWNKLKYNRIANSEFNKKYPEKFTDVRMVELKDLSPNLTAPPAERDTTLIKQIQYTSTFFEKSDRGDAFNYSAGWWYFDIYMPGGDTLKIKRFASFRDPEMKLYKIPKELGGREDVLFIIQEPNEIHPEQVGGMYVIRPKNYKETPQYKEQEAKELAKEKEQKQKESQEAVKKRRNFLPD